MAELITGNNSVILTMIKHVIIGNDTNKIITPHKACNTKQTKPPGPIRLLEQFEPEMLKHQNLSEDSELETTKTVDEEREEDNKIEVTAGNSEL